MDSTVKQNNKYLIRHEAPNPTYLTYLSYLLIYFLFVWGKSKKRDNARARPGLPPGI